MSRDENVGSATEDGVIDADAPEGSDGEAPTFAPVSTADGSPTSEPEVHGVHATPDAANPESLVEGNRVATAKDME